MTLSVVIELLSGHAYGHGQRSSFLTAATGQGLHLQAPILQSGRAPPPAPSRPLFRIGWDGRRSILAVELANRESRSSWRDFLLGLRERGLFGVEFVVSDDHAGVRQAIVEVLPEAAWQRGYVHFLRNALDYVPRKVDDDCLRELRGLYDRRDLAAARRDLAAWLAKWQATYPKLCGWVEEHIEETLTFYRLPRQHHKHLQSTNLLGA